MFFPFSIPINLLFNFFPSRSVSRAGQTYIVERVELLDTIHLVALFHFPDTFFLTQVYGAMAIIVRFRLLLAEF